MHKWCRYAFLATAVWLSACSSFKPQAYNREANTEIKKIAVLSMPQANVRLFVFNAVGYNFGLIGTLITEANRNSKENWLQAQVKSDQFDQFNTFQASFNAAMLARGYALNWPQPLTHLAKDVKRDSFGLRKKYAPVAQANAQIDLGLNFVGYAAAGSGKSQPYRPTALMTVRLLSADGRKTLYQDQFLYHNVTDQKLAIVLEPSVDYTYPKFSDLEAAGPKAIVGLKEAVEALADAVSKQL